MEISNMKSITNIEQSERIASGIYIFIQFDLKSNIKKLMHYTYQK